MKRKVDLKMLVECIKDTDLVNAIVQGLQEGTDIPVEDIEVKRISRSHEILQLEEGSRTAVQYVSARTLDRDEEIIVPGGLNFKAFRASNMQVFWNHDYNELIGSDQKIMTDDFGAVAWTKYADTGEGTRANVTWALKQQGHLKTNSIGFAILAATQPGHADFDRIVGRLARAWPEQEEQLKQARRIITRSMVIEHSDVGVASNVDAATIAVAKNYATDEVIEKMFGIQIKDYVIVDPKIIEAAEKKADEVKAAKEAADKIDAEKARKKAEKDARPKVKRIASPKPYRPNIKVIKQPESLIDTEDIAKAVKDQLAMSSGKV